MNRELDLPYWEELKRLRANEVRLKAIVAEQAEDEGLWFICRLISEDYLQRALRRLHAAIEGKTPEQCAIEVLASRQEGYEGSR